MSSLFTRLVSTFYTKSVNMFYMDILPLSDLIKAEMERRNISIREFADLVGSTHPTIASILDGRVPSYKTCTQLVPVLRQPLTVILRADLKTAHRRASPVDNWRL